jgi:hypothetical protein
MHVYVFPGWNLWQAYSPLAAVLLDKSRCENTAVNFWATQKTAVRASKSGANQRISLQVFLNQTGPVELN